jgi:hypothetical protein
MSKTPIAHGTLTALAAAVALLATGCAGTADGAEADGCRDNGDWSARERAEWLRPAVSFDGPAAGGDAVVIGPRGTDHGGPLCEPVTVQVEFWRVTASGAGVELSTAQRIHMGTDGTEERSIGFPPGLAAGERNACTGVLMAAYVGARLADTERPKNPGPASSGGKDLEFRTDRIAAYRLVPPSAPETCGGQPDADEGEEVMPSPSGSANSWGAYHP